VPITTAGDRDRTRPFGEIGSRGVFVKELEEALLAARIDVAVHSAKDMTSTDTDGLVVGAYPPREDPRDALCGVAALRPGLRIGTASARRRAQLLAAEPTLSVEPLRGNIDTRLRKRGERGLDAVVLAACGLDRLGLGAQIDARLEPEQMLPEAGQGALALQVRAGEEHLVAVADDDETRRRVEAERRCRRRRRRLPRARGRASRRRRPDGAHRRRGRHVARAAAGGRPRRAGPRARGPRAVTGLPGDAPHGHAAARPERARTTASVTRPAHRRHGRVTRAPIPFLSPWAGGG
jgi:hypothetical protein